MKHILLFVVVFSFFSIHTFGKIKLPSVFSDNMVLQQNSKVAIWGWGSASETIKIVTSWNNKDTVKVKVGNTSAWETSIQTIGAGGPYSIQILGSTSSSIQYNNVMLGEVWICSGQSNMELYVNYDPVYKQGDAAKLNNPNIRIFNIPKFGAEYPQQTCDATWTVSTVETMRTASAVGYFFGCELQKKLNVPVGLIISAWGGSPAEPFIEKSRIENNPILNRSKYSENIEWWPGKAGVLYNAMIFPLVPYGISGVIWYQGESNCINYPIYSLLMKTLIENWRSDFKKDFPFYFVQIAPCDYGVNGTSEYVREQQEIVSKTIPNTGMVVISDLVDDIKNIHPRNKLDVGKRLANYALTDYYKLEVGAYKSPMYQALETEKNKIRLLFSNVLTGLKCTGKTPVKFLISGDDQNFVPATAKIEGSTILLSSKLVNMPVAVRFCFDGSSMPDVFSAEGLPLAPFRTDNWEK